MNNTPTGDVPGQTPLDEDDARGLRLTYVSTRGELDAAEQANIVRGRAWALQRHLSVAQILDDGFLRRLHREMFGEVWTWAGTYRRSNKNIGIDWPQIAEALRNLCGDANMWFSAAAHHRVAAGDDADASSSVGVHHRLVVIHPFVNGNGRHARLVADLLAHACDVESFSWGGATGAMPTAEGDPVRTAYLEALRAADRGDLEQLVRFARS